MASAQRLESNNLVCNVSLLFPAGERPRAEDVRALARDCGQFSLSIDPSAEGNVDEGWLELLATGLTFDLTGLAPFHPDSAFPCTHHFGLGSDFEESGLEAITLAPGPHLAAGVVMFPVVRCLALLAAQLAQLGNARAVAWHPARACSSPEYFQRGVLGWIEGGAFPGLGLTALVNNPDGSMQSEGLELFTGQELLLPAEMCTDRSEAAKIALRLLNWLVEHGRIEQKFTFTGPAGEPLILEPIEDSVMLRVWRGAN